jgi:putative ABC transport system ATP-binding protein
VAAAGASLLMVSHDARLSTRFDRVVHLPDIARVTRGGLPA